MRRMGRNGLRDDRLHILFSGRAITLPSLNPVDDNVNSIVAAALDARETSAQRVRLIISLKSLSVFSVLTTTSSKRNGRPSRE